MGNDGSARDGLGGPAPAGGSSADASASLGLLFEAMVSLESPDEARDLLADLCTPRELEDLAQRLEIARMLDAGASYVRIQELTGASAATVSRVGRCLKYGPGGYRTVLDRLAGR